MEEFTNRPKNRFEVIESNFEKFKSWLESAEGMGVSMGTNEECAEFLSSLNNEDRIKLLESSGVDMGRTFLSEYLLEKEEERKVRGR